MIEEFVLGQATRGRDGDYMCDRGKRLARLSHPRSRSWGRAFGPPVRHGAAHAPRLLCAL